MKEVEPICDILALRIERTQGLSLDQCLLLSNSYYSGKYMIFRNAGHMPIGYVIWADACEETVFRIANSGIYPVYPYEWDEGNICMIFDVVFSYGGCYEARKKFLEFVNSYDQVAFQKRSSVKIYRKTNGRFVRAEIKSFTRTCAEVVHE